MKFKEFIKKYKLILIPLLLSSLFFTIGIASIQDKTRTTDESSHMIRGIMLLQTGDFRLNQHHPYLFNAINSIPTLFDKDLKTESLDSERWQLAQKDGMGSELVRINGGNIEFSENVLYWPRVSMILISSLFIYLFFYLLNKEFGLVTASVATALLVLNPTFIAHSRIVTTDAPTLMTIFLASFSLYKHLKIRDTKSLIIFILLGAVALLSKYTAVPVAILWIFILFAHGQFPIQKKTILKKFWEGIKISFVVIISWILIMFVAYGFQFKTLEDMSYGNEAGIESTLSHFRSVNRRIQEDYPNIDIVDEMYYAYENIKFPFPQYIKGFYDNVFKHDYYGHGSYLIGEFSNGGQWYYFPVAFITKETVPFIFLSIISLLFGVYYIIKNPKILHNYGVLFAVPIFLLLLSLQSSINLGIRHLLPIYPFLMIGIGAVVSSLWKKKYVKEIFIALISFAFFSILNSFPNYISYFNEFAGGNENGYKYVRDSNFDWDQNSGIAERYAEDNPLHIVVRVESLFGRPERMNEENLLLRDLYEGGHIKPIKILNDTHWVFDLTQ